LTSLLLGVSKLGEEAKSTPFTRCTTGEGEGIDE
jgi:hypothetical protein